MPCCCNHDAHVRHTEEPDIRPGSDAIGPTSHACQQVALIMHNAEQSDLAKL